MLISQGALERAVMVHNRRTVDLLFRSRLTAFSVTSQYVLALPDYTSITCISSLKNIDHSLTNTFDATPHTLNTNPRVPQENMCLFLYCRYYFQIYKFSRPPFVGSILSKTECLRPRLQSNGTQCLHHLHMSYICCYLQTVLQKRLFIYENICLLKGN